MEKKKRILAKDLVGKEYNGFQVLDYKRENNRTYLYVSCPVCGKEKWMRKDTLDEPSVISCGCYNKGFNLIQGKDIANKEFGRLKALYSTEKRDSNGSVIWHCVCKCGNEKNVSSGLLMSGRVNSCGCLSSEIHSELFKKVGNNIKENYCKDGTNVLNLISKTPKNNTSGFKGVICKKDRSKWVAQICFKGKNYKLGSYDKKEDAITARKIAEENIFGNFIDWYAKNYPENWKKIKK